MPGMNSAELAVELDCSGGHDRPLRIDRALLHKQGKHNLTAVVYRATPTP